MTWFRSPVDSGAYIGGCVCAEAVRGQRTGVRGQGWQPPSLAADADVDADGVNPKERPAGTPDATWEAQ